MDLLLQDIRVSIRALLARPSFAATAILTLALGIGATTTVFSIVFGVLLKPLPYREADRVVALGNTTRSQPTAPVFCSVSPISYDDWQEIKSLESVALYSGANAVITGKGEPQVVKAGRVTPDFFRTIGARLILGRDFTREENRPNGPAAIIISHGIWREHFGGDPTVIGKQLTVSGGPRTIVGVTEAGFEYPVDARLWFPVANNPENCGRGCVYLNGMGRLKPGVTLAVAQQELRAQALRFEKEFTDTNLDVTVTAKLLQDHLVGDVRRPLKIMFGAILMVLLIACANVANLQLVRGAARAGEMAVRATLGASRMRLIAQLLTESMALAVVGGVLGLLFANWALDLIIALSPGDLPRLKEVTIGWPSIAFAFALTAITALMFGLYPALQQTRSSLASALRAGGRGDTGPRQTLGRSLLLAGEVAFSVVLLLGAGLLIRSFIEINAVKLGFDHENVYEFTLGLPGVKYNADQSVAFYDQLRERLKGLPNVENASVVVGPPLGPSDIVVSFRRLDQPKPGPGLEPSAGARTFDHEMLETLRIPVLEGRGFEATDRRESLPVILINREMARQFFPDGSPIGKQIYTGISWGYDNADAYTIVGVIDNIRGQGITTAPQAEYYLPASQTGAGSATIMIRTKTPSANILYAARAEVKRLDPSLPLIRPGATSDVVKARMAAPRFYMSLLAGFAVLAIVLSAIGIYGVVAYVVTQRKKEIGVRIALGADVSNVMGLVLWQGMKPALIGTAVGVAGALAAGKVITALLYGVGERDLVTFAAIPVLVIATVAVACLIPAQRASRTPPAIALRSEQL